jgi:hypothetical protein
MTGTSFTPGSITRSMRRIRCLEGIPTAREVISPAGLPLTGGLQETKANNITIQESHTFSATKVNQFRVYWTYFKDRAGFPLAGRNLAAEEFGLLNLTPATTAYGLPQLIVTGTHDNGC